MAINKQRLSLRFQTATGCSEKKANAFTQTYIDLCATQIVRHLNKDAGERVYVSIDSIRRQLGDIIVKGKRYYAFNEFQTFPERIFSPVLLGSNITEELTMADINYKLEEILIATGDQTELVKELYKDYQSEIDNDLVDWIPIDQFSIDSYIKGNLDIDRSRLKDDAKNTVNNYLYHALRIQLIARAFDGQMPHVINESQFGRKYYRGPNLQNTPKIVRHAALGDCYEYDLESSVFAWKYNYFQQICQENDESVPMPATGEYLEYKSAIRKRTAQTVFDNDEEGYVNIIKDAITAIGFGASARATGYMKQGRYEPTSLNNIIKAKTRLERFLNDPWVREFIEEQKSINTIIMEVVKLQGLDTELKKIPELSDRAGRLRPNSVISYLYQHAERNIMESIIPLCDDSEVLLMVHDCIYTRRPIRLLPVRERLMELGKHYRIRAVDHDRYAYNDDQERHRQHIAEEEMHAARITGRHTLPGVKTIDYQENQSDIGAYDGDRVYEYDPEEDPYFDDVE